MRGRALYKKRGQTVEPVLGQIKAGRGIWHFMRRGLAACAPGMDIDLRDTQSSEVVAKWKGDFTSGGLVELSGWG